MKHGTMIWTMGMNGSKTVFMKCPTGCLMIWHEVKI